VDPVWDTFGSNIDKKFFKALDSTRNE
jgi:hypothetical protein